MDVDVKLPSFKEVARDLGVESSRQLFISSIPPPSAANRSSDPSPPWVRR